MSFCDTARIGIDEVGRGALAGPVTAGAVLRWGTPLPGEGESLSDRLRDSKRLTRRQRERWHLPLSTACPWALAGVGPAQIDRVNILNATLMAMAHACSVLIHNTRSDLRRCAHLIVTVDGQVVPSGLYSRLESLLPEVRITIRAQVKADNDVAEVCAAAILAKVWRDRALYAHSLRFPDYGFERHVGYGTRQHLAALARLGPSPIHRLSFAPLKQAASQAAS